MFFLLQHGHIGQNDIFNTNLMAFCTRITLFKKKPFLHLKFPHSPVNQTNFPNPIAHPVYFSTKNVFDFTFLYQNKCSSETDKNNDQIFKRNKFIRGGGPEKITKKVRRKNGKRAKLPWNYCRPMGPVAYFMVVLAFDKKKLRKKSVEEMKNGQKPKPPWNYCRPMGSVAYFMVVLAFDRKKLRKKSVEEMKNGQKPKPPWNYCRPMGPVAYFMVVLAFDKKKLRKKSVEEMKNGQKPKPPWNYCRPMGSVAYFMVVLAFDKKKLRKKSVEKTVKNQNYHEITADPWGLWRISW